MARDTPSDVAGWNAQELVDLIGWLGVTEVTPAIPPVADFEAYPDRLRWVGRRGHARSQVNYRQRPETPVVRRQKGSHR